ncbi:hypothetical protein M2405_004895 [Rhodococcus erythropolis]|nr:hypothetical protein [Rhodococcus erythropolis]MCS4256584.1 hypothetical protein [Rhodococcus erythropolis]MCW2430725.1 hypothetical protein [Rhodococcus erythropolis]
MLGIDRILGTARALATEVLRTILDEIEASNWITNKFVPPGGP